MLYTLTVKITKPEGLFYAFLFWAILQSSIQITICSTLNMTLYNKLY